MYSRACNASGVQHGATLAHTDFYDPDGRRGEDNGHLQLSAGVVEGGSCQAALGDTVFELKWKGERGIHWSPTSSSSFNCELRDEAWRGRFSTSCGKAY